MTITARSVYLGLSFYFVLQFRAIHTENGVIEPLEYPAKLLRGYSEFDYMAAFAGSLFH